MARVTFPKIAARPIHWCGNPRCQLMLLLSGSYVIRLVLALSGGQLFFPDEGRFRRALDFLGAGDTTSWVDRLFILVGYPDHPLFAIAALPGALVQLGWQGAQGVHSTAEDPVGLSIAAAVNAWWSVAAIALVFGIARRVGITSGGAISAALLTSLSSSMLYYSRHLVPYDAALCLILVGVFVGVRPHTTRSRSLACGAIAGAAFLSYSGYWAGAFTTLAVHSCFHDPGERRTALRRWCHSAVGFAVPVLLLVALNVAHGGGSFLRKSIAFATSATQGDFGEAWSFPAEYLWQSDRAVLLSLLAGAFLLLTTRASHDSGARRSAVIFLLAGGGIYVMLASSGTIGVSVVYGRLVRQMVPFLCVAAAAAFAEIYSVIPRRKWIAGVLGTALGVGAAATVAPHLTITFPREFERAYSSLEPTYTSTLRGQDEPVADQSARFVLVNIRLPYPVTGTRAGPPGRTIASATHALELLPYQYEGYSPNERTILRSTDISMRLVDTTPSP